MYGSGLVILSVNGNHVSNEMDVTFNMFCPRMEHRIMSKRLGRNVVTPENRTVIKREAKLLKK